MSNPWVLEAESGWESGIAVSILIGLKPVGPLHVMKLKTNSGCFAYIFACSRRLPVFEAAPASYKTHRLEVFFVLSILNVVCGKPLLMGIGMTGLLGEIGWLHINTRSVLILDFFLGSEISSMLVLRFTVLGLMCWFWAVNHAGVLSNRTFLGLGEGGLLDP